MATSKKTYTHVGKDNPVQSNQDNPVQDNVEKAIYDQLNPRIKDLENKINEAQSNTIQQLGIFVAFFTFISIEFQLGKSGFDFNKFWSFTAYFAGVLLTFILVMHIILNRILEWGRIIAAVILVVFLVSLSILFLQNLH